MEFSEKIHNYKKVIYYKSKENVRILIGKTGMNFSQLRTAIEKYLNSRNNFSRDLFKINQKKMNEGIRIEVCGYNVTVGFAFRLYNEIIENLGLPYQIYGKLYYEKETAIQISPSN